jgi:hypothetical protein
MVKIQNAVNADWTEDVVEIVRMFSSTWSSARCSFDGMMRMSSGGDGIVNGFFFMLLVSSGVAMVNDLEAGKEQFTDILSVCSELFVCTLYIQTVKEL